MSFPIVMGTLIETMLERISRRTAQVMAFRSGLASASSFTIDESAFDGGRSALGRRESARASRPVGGEDEVTAVSDLRGEVEVEVVGVMGGVGVEGVSERWGGCGGGGRVEGVGGEEGVWRREAEEWNGRAVGGRELRIGEDDDRVGGGIQAGREVENGRIRGGGLAVSKVRRGGIEVSSLEKEAHSP